MPRIRTRTSIITCNRFETKIKIDPVFLLPPSSRKYKTITYVCAQPEFLFKFQTDSNFLCNFLKICASCCIRILVTRNKAFPERKITKLFLNELPFVLINIPKYETGWFIKKQNQLCCWNTGSHFQKVLFELHMKTSDSFHYSCNFDVVHLIWFEDFHNIFRIRNIFQ